MLRFGCLAAGPCPLPPDNDAEEADALVARAAQSAIAAEIGLDWPPRAGPRRAGRPGRADAWQDALVSWVGALEAVPERPPPARMPAGWKKGMSIFGEETESQAGGEEAAEEPPEEPAEEPADEPTEPPRKSLRKSYHRATASLRKWLEDYSDLRTRQGWSLTAVARNVRHVWGDNLKWVSGRLLQRWARERKARLVLPSREQLTPLYLGAAQKLSDAGLPMSAPRLSAIFGLIGKGHGL